MSHQRMRESSAAMRCTSAAVRSVDPSSTTIASQCVSVCARSDASEAAMVDSAWYAAMITDTPNDVARSGASG